VRWRGVGGGFELLHAAHDGWRFLPGAPRHDRLLALSADRLVVLDVVRGRGRHRLRNALHLHPDAPAQVRVAWIPHGAFPQTGPAPLHERFNETREMTAMAFEVEAELPWVGGYVLTWAAVPDEGWELAHQDGEIRARTGQVELEWRIGAQAGPSVTVRGFEATPGSAT
jgi:hypothetical protein